MLFLVAESFNQWVGQYCIIITTIPIPLRSNRFSLKVSYRCIRTYAYATIPFNKRKNR